jgi:multiple sugar transport system substrate-binding protein
VIQPLLRGDPQEVDAWKQIFTNFEAKNPGLKVDAIYTTGDYDAKTVTFVASGTPPGLWFPAADTGVKHWAAKGLIQVLDQYIQRDKYDLSGFYEQYLPYMKFEGKMVALPVDEWPWNVYYNKSLFQKAGAPPPPTDWSDKTWTWDKFLETGKTLTRSNGGKTTQWGIGDASFSGARFSAMLFGGDWFPEDSYVDGWIKQFTGNAPEVIQAYQYLSDLSHKYHVSPSSDEQKANGGNISKMFLSGLIGMHISDASFIETLRRQTSGVDWALAAIPQPADKPRRTLIWADYWCYFQGIKDPDAAWTLLKYMLTPEAQVLYPLQSGAVPSLKSLAPNWIKLRQDSNKVPPEVLQVAINAIPVSHVSADNFTVNWPDLGLIIEKPMGDVLSGKQDAQTAIQSLTAAAQDVIKKTSAAAKS